MENDRDLLMAITQMQRHDRALLQVLEEAVFQLLAQLIAPDPAGASRFEAGMRVRMNDILEEAEGANLEDHRTMTLMLAAILASAGRPPSRG